MPRTQRPLRRLARSVVKNGARIVLSAVKEGARIVLSAVRSAAQGGRNGALSSKPGAPNVVKGGKERMRRQARHNSLGF